MELKFEAELWEWQGQGAWCFISLPKEFYKEIRLISSGPKRGFGSVRVEVTVGKSIWKTSIFPDSKSDTYVLPIKKGVRRSENIHIGDEVSLKVRIIES